MKKNWEHIINTGNCPSIDKLLLYQDGKLSKEESFSIENHLAGCMICSDISDGISELPSFEVLEKTESEIKNDIHKLLSEDNRTRKIAIYRRLAIAASIILLIGIPALIYKYTIINKNVIVQHITEAKAPVPSKIAENKKEYASPESQNSLEKEIEQKHVRTGLVKTKTRQQMLALVEVADSSSVLQFKTEKMASGSAIDVYQTVAVGANKSEFQTNELNKSSASVSAATSPSFDSGSGSKPAISEKSAGKSFRITYDESYAQMGRSITGKVTDRAGIPMPGVNVHIQGSSKGTVTDIEGRFIIDIEQTDKVLSFSFIGYKQENITLGVTDTLLIALNEETSSLNEVVITGYGKKSLFARTATKKMGNKSKIEYKQRKESERQIDSLKIILKTDKTNIEVVKMISEKYIELNDKNNALNGLNDLNSLLTDSDKKKNIEEIINLVRDDKFEKALIKLKKLSIN